jgi:hypothetical protein
VGAPKWHFTSVDACTTATQAGSALRADRCLARLGSGVECRRRLGSHSLGGTRVLPLVDIWGSGGAGVCGASTRIAARAGKPHFNNLTPIRGFGFPPTVQGYGRTAR